MIFGLFQRTSTHLWLEHLDPLAYGVGSLHVFEPDILDVPVLVL